MLGKTSLSLTRGDNAFSEEPFRFFLFYHRTMNFCFYNVEKPVRTHDNLVLQEGYSPIQTTESCMGLTDTHQ